MAVKGLLLAAAAAAVHAQNLCVVDFGNSSFNIEPLVGQSPYTLQDASNNANSQNYTYVFNFCKSVDPGWIGLSGKSCDVTYPGPAPYNTAAYNKTGPALAFQVANENSVWRVPDGDKCHRLGDSQTISYGLINPQNPSKGIYVQYGGGDQCMAFGGKARSLRLWIPCDPDTINLPDDEYVQEYRCSYELWLKSAYGCPVQCPVVALGNGAKALCSNHGICEFDAAIGNSKCFCNDGWTGADCGSPVTVQTGLSPVGAMLVVVCVFLALTLSFLGYLWFRIRSLRLDPAAYSALRSGPDEDKSAPSSNFTVA